MTDYPKRSLRMRKPNTYLTPEVFGSETFGYVHPNAIKDTLVPEAELNSNAKILVKFISQLNKSLKEYQMKDQGEEGERMVAHEPHPHRRLPRSANTTEESRKDMSYKKDIREDHPKKEKDIPYSRNPCEHPEYSVNHPKNQQGQKPKTQTKNTPKTMSSHPYPNNQVLAFLAQANLQKKNSLTALFTQGGMTPEGQLNMYQTLAQMNQHQPNIQYQAKDRQRQSQSESIDTRIKSQKKKLFGRSEYHIAIAYHIHLEKLKSSKQEDPSIGICPQLDPTYHSKKLKERSVGNNDQH